ncbi:MAG: N-formylglutamate amidohydrolase [Candidatus Cyclobacteriaceae bacterium M2_1C_046]
MEVFNFKEPSAQKVPILISVPHSGTFFPEDIKADFKPEQLSSLEDTDWYVEKLYDFAPSLGMSMIVANYHRWVIDLNRNPESKPLYDDGRNVTALCPTSTFNEKPLYHEKRIPGAKEIDRRLENYYKPYYEKISETLDSFINEFGIALLWDAHSIKQYVPGIKKEIFPDLIVGDNDGKAAGDGISMIALDNLETERYNLAYNKPFKGGNITRHFGNPAQNQHALQLEMTKINYMDNDEVHYDEQRAGHMRELLISVFSSLIEKLPDERI